MADKKPNILFIMSDDIGWFNLSCYNLGIMGYKTPNLDRIAKEGALFTDFYGQQSCTAGRAAFITGQSPIRTGLTKVGLPGAALGLGPDDPSVGDFMKNFGYATGQFGKNHLGDRNEHLPTVHGFDEFFGNLYHLNAEEEPENPDYPKDPNFRKKFGPRGVLKCKASDKDDNTVDPQFGRVGKQVIENTGSLDTKRMETVDEEFLAAAKDFIDRKTKENKPWFCYFNTTRMHVWTHLKPSSAGKTGLGVYPDGMVELDGYIGELLAKLDELGIADNTMVVFTTDNGAEVCSWPDGGSTPFHGEKDTNWEGGWRVPFVMRWPGVVDPGRIINDICSLQDMIPTFAAAAGEPNLVEKVKKGYAIAGKTFKVHLDGFNLLPFLSGKEKESPRKGFMYWSDDGDLMALRVENWKMHFVETRAHGMKVWEEPFVSLRLPNLFNLRSDPFERASIDATIFYGKWKADHMFLLVPAQAIVTEFLKTFEEFPPRAKAASFSIEQVMEKLMPKDTGTELIKKTAPIKAEPAPLL
ncbi:arylsulfatase [Niastella yeongjuensis]|uniref:Arylsulfatase n=1 Tax=Niastella yeongjuensis TaxID=354355 RepID=A0A1V9DXM9_9BACT|nr:arylsulfatase [Niastella yeongjuensis]OQP38633.1 arylsulfatase [Niastella yeongjuensis]SEO38770.1 arylsulfatase [Niastella yeongjuensis]